MVFAASRLADDVANGATVAVFVMALAALAAIEVWAIRLLYRRRSSRRRGRRQETPAGRR